MPLPNPAAPDQALLRLCGTKLHNTTPHHCWTRLYHTKPLPYIARLGHAVALRGRTRPHSAVALRGRTALCHNETRRYCALATRLRAVAAPRPTRSAAYP